MISFLGCLNTPSKASRLCKEHVMASTSFRNDEKLMVGLETEECDKEKEQADDLLPICVINDKVTRNGKFLEVKGFVQKPLEIHKVSKILGFCFTETKNLKR